MDPKVVLQWIQIIQELLAMWGRLQPRSVAGLPVSGVFTNYPMPDPTNPTMAAGALKAMATVLFPQLPPEQYLDAMVGALDQGTTMGTQTMLNRLNANLQVDGKWGERTVAAIKAFQLLKGLPAHGWTDDATWAALVLEASKPIGEGVKI